MSKARRRRREKKDNIIKKVVKNEIKKEFNRVTKNVTDEPMEEEFHIDVKSAINSFSFWFIVILLLEIAFRVVMKYSFNIESLINIVLFDALLSSILCVLMQVFYKRNTIFTIIILVLFAVLFSIPVVFYNAYKTYFSLTNLELADQVGGFFSMAVSIVLKNILYIFINFVPLILYCIFKKKLKVEHKTLNNCIIYIVAFIISLCLYFTNIYISKDKPNGSYNLYMQVNNIALNYEKFGVLNFYRIDTARYLFGFEENPLINFDNNNLVEEENKEDNKKDENNEEKVEEVKEVVYGDNALDIDFDIPTTNSEIATINDYMGNDIPTKKNKYTGMFKGYNLVYITAESFYGPAIDKDLTPTLYKLTHSGFIFNNFYTPNVLSTIGGEFQSVTGLYPEKSILSKWREGTNYFPYGLGTVFSDAGYYTYAYHDHYYGFQDRYKYLRSQGFDNFKAVGNGMEKLINSNIWPESDIEMMQGTIEDYNEVEAPFLAYYMTVSGHMEYNWDNAMALKNKDEVIDLDCSTEVKAYIATLIELDRALEVLINELENSGKLDNTVFVLLADHYPYALSPDSINSIWGEEKDEIVETNHNNLIIWNNKMETIEIDKVCMSSDVLPTVLNLFGIEYDSRLFTGKDILSNATGLAIMENRSWITNKGTYLSASDEFIPNKGYEDTTDEYIISISNIVQNRLNIAKWIIKNNYYKYLLQ